MTTLIVVGGGGASGDVGGEGGKGGKGGPTTNAIVSGLHLHHVVGLHLHQLPQPRPVWASGVRAVQGQYAGALLSNLQARR